jgi:hypothetical protein
MLELKVEGKLEWKNSYKNYFKYINNIKTNILREVGIMNKCEVYICQSNTFLWGVQIFELQKCSRIITTSSVGRGAKTY